jgi:solute carrier family 5 (sodium-coupled monocarboxylate transporter), member 8/12
MAGPVGVFSPIDYALFFIVILSSTFIGIYFGFFSKTKQDNKNEYLIGSRNMAFFPIVMSLIAR